LWSGFIEEERQWQANEDKANFILDKYFAGKTAARGKATELCQ
jgi:hypothetical protein